MRKPEYPYTVRRSPRHLSGVSTSHETPRGDFEGKELFDTPTGSDRAAVVLGGKVFGVFDCRNLFFEHRVTVSTIFSEIHGRFGFWNPATKLPNLFLLHDHLEGKQRTCK